MNKALAFILGMLDLVQARLAASMHSKTQMFKHLQS